jgi:FixJ family two-component response regulator
MTNVQVVFIVDDSKRNGEALRKLLKSQETRAMAFGSRSDLVRLAAKPQTPTTRSPPMGGA